MKGIESETGKRLSVVFSDEVPNANVSIWVGPGHAEDFSAGKHGCMLICSYDMNNAKELANKFSTNRIRLYYDNDMIGNEIGAASKNVMGIIAGMLDGVNEVGLKGALMARGAREIARLAQKMGGNERSIFGLSHLGDYEATLFSKFSHNRMFGENFVKQVPYEKLAEGVPTVKALVLLSQEYNEELPICNAVFRIVFNNENYSDVLDSLFMRDIKYEFN